MSAPLSTSIHVSSSLNSSLAIQQHTSCLQRCGCSRPPAAAAAAQRRRHVHSSSKSSRQHSSRQHAEPQDRDYIPPPPMPPPPPPPRQQQQAGMGGGFQQQQQYANATPKFQELGWREIKERYLRPSYLPASFSLGALTIGLRLGAANYTFADSPLEFLGTAVSTGVMCMALAWVLFDFTDEPPSGGGGGSNLSSPPPPPPPRK